MRKLEDIVETHTRLRDGSERVSVIVATVIVVVHFTEMNVGKISFGGVELAFREPYILSGALGIALYYLSLVAVRSHFARAWALSVLEPGYEEEAKAAQNVLYTSFNALDRIVFVAEGLLVGLALYVVTPSVGRLIALMLRSMF